MFNFVATLVMTAAIARDRGYRLAWGRRLQSSAASGTI
jgi:hypothetical protein